MGTITKIPLTIELLKNQSLKKSDIEELSKWCDMQQHLPKIMENDLAIFLHANEFDLDETKKNIENYYSMRAILPTFFENRDPSSKTFKHTSQVMSIIPLEKLTGEGYRVIFIKLIDTDPKKYIFDETVKYFHMVLDVCIYEEGTCDGYVFIVDIGGANTEHYNRLTMTSLRTFFRYTVKGCPIRWKGLHYVNTSVIMNKTKDFLKSSVINNRFVDNLYFHHNLQSLSKFIPLHILPIELGGNSGKVSELQAKNIGKLNTYHQLFKSMENYHKVASHLLREKNLTINNLFGPKESLQPLLHA